MFVEVTGEKLVGGGGLFAPPILNRVKSRLTGAQLGGRGGERPSLSYFEYQEKEP